MSRVRPRRTARAGRRQFRGPSAALSIIVVARCTVPSVSAMAGAPWWVLVGGALGAFYVWSSIYSVSTLGVVTLMATLVFGQMVAAIVLDAIGAFGLQGRIAVTGATERCE